MKKINDCFPSENEIVEIRGYENCAYRAILTSLKEEEDNDKKLRNLRADKIKKDGIDENIYLERGCNSLEEYLNKIRYTNFYSDEHLGISKKFLGIKENKKEIDDLEEDIIIKDNKFQI